MDTLVITSSKSVDGEIEHIIELFANGLETLHLRKPKHSNSKLAEIIESIPEMYRSRIIVHGHYDLARRYGLKGYHLKRRHRSNTWKNKLKRFSLKLRNPKAVVCTTFHSVQSLKECETNFSYVLLENVFNDDTRFNYQEPSGMNLIRSVILKSKQRVIAVGGVRPERIKLIQSIGFHGMGISYTYLHQSPNDILEEFQKFLTPKNAT